MLVFLDERSCYKVSAIIGVCSTNFCSFVADKRKVLFPDNNTISKSVFDNDNTDKIFQVNDRVLFGAAGIFYHNEAILDPLTGFRNMEDITLRLAIRATKEYIKRSCFPEGLSRTYMIGGKDNRGRFCIYEIHLNWETGNIDVVERSSDSPEGNYGVSILVPNSLFSKKSFYLDMVSGCITGSTTHGELMKKLSRIISSMADEDESIGKDTMILDVF